MMVPFIKLKPTLDAGDLRCFLYIFCQCNFEVA